MSDFDRHDVYLHEKVDKVYDMMSEMKEDISSLKTTNELECRERKAKARLSSSIWGAVAGIVATIVAKLTMS